MYLFLSPPSTTELRSRLEGRGTETPESISKRLEAARKELQYAQENKGKGVDEGGYEVVIVNDDVKRAGEVLEKVAMGWEGWAGAGDDLPEFDLGALGPVKAE